MKRSPLNRKSPKQRFIDACLDVIRKLKHIETGSRCEICGKKQEFLPFPLQLFHILRRQKYPRIILLRQNILLTCGTPYMNNPTFCHDAWHKCSHDEYEYQKVLEGIIRARGENYKDALLLADKTHEKITMGYLQLQLFALKEELKIKKGEK